MVHRIIVQGQEKGEVKRSIDPQVAAHIFFGGLETICTGSMLKSIPSSTDEETDRVKRTVLEVLLVGIAEGEVR